MTLWTILKPVYYMTMEGRNAGSLGNLLFMIEVDDSSPTGRIMVLFDTIVNNIGNVLEAASNLEGTTFFGTSGGHHRGRAPIVIVPGTIG